MASPQQPGGPRQLQVEEACWQALKMSRPFPPHVRKRRRRWWRKEQGRGGQKEEDLRCGLAREKWKALAWNFFSLKKEEKDLFSPVVNLVSLFLCPTKHDKVLFHKVFSIKATKLTQSGAICFYRNSSSQSRRGKGAQRERILLCLGLGGGTHTNEEALNSGGSPLDFLVNLYL